MAFDDILGQERALRILHKTLVENRLAHAYLFYGVPGIGKKLAAFQFVKALYCLTSNTDACDHCTSCHRIDAGNHPDVTLITPDGTTIKIEQVRALQHQLNYKPYENQRTTILIDGCEFLSLPAANALLKTLEEPSSNALLLLLAGKKEALPLTIISRCQLVPFQPLSPAHLHTILERQGVDVKTATLAAPLVEGRLDRFFQSDFSQTLATRKNAYDIIKGVTQSTAITLFLQSRKLAGKREQCEELLHWLSLFCRDLTALKVAHAPSLYNADLRTELAPIAEHARLDSLLDAFELAEQLRINLSFNANPQLVFEQLIVQLQQTFSIAQRPSGR